METQGLLSSFGLDNIANIPQDQSEIQALKEMRRKKREEAAAILLQKKSPQVIQPSENEQAPVANSNPQYKKGDFDVPAPTSFGGKLLKSVFGGYF